MTSKIVVGLILFSSFSAFAAAQAKAPTGYTDTPTIPGSKWKVHDDARPRPPVITPGTFSTPDMPGKPPSDAIILFDGKNLDKWKNDKGEAAKWKIVDGAAETGGKAGDIITRDEFGDCQLHIEWQTPNPPKGDSQGRGNSGVFLFGLYEIQVLDSYNNVSYADGQASGLYGQMPPLVNASRPPGEWQVYDIVFEAPIFKDGKMEKTGFVTVFHNGVITQNHTPVLGATGHKVLPLVTVHGAKGPVKLQDHGNPVHFRNIWIRPLGSVV